MKSLLIGFLVLTAIPAFAICEGEQTNKLVEICGKPTIKKLTLTERYLLNSSVLEEQKGVIEEKILNAKLFLNEIEAANNPSLELLFFVQQAIMLGKEVCVTKVVSKTIGGNCINSKQVNSFRFN